MSDWQNRYQRLLFDRPHPKVLRVTMNRPDKYNATDTIMHTELVNVWRDIDGDDTVNCVIIQGAGGKVFSAGGDFNYLDELPFFCSEVLPRLERMGLRDKRRASHALSA